MIQLYESSYLSIHYDRHLRLIELEWTDPEARPEDMRAGFWQALLLAERYQVRAWLGDLRRMPPIPEAEQQWLQQHWFPRYLQLTLDKVAVLNPLDEAGEQTVSKVVNTAETLRNGFHPASQYFENLEEARQWLRMPLVVPQLPAKS